MLSLDSVYLYTDGRVTNAKSLPNLATPGSGGGVGE